MSNSIFYCLLLLVLALFFNNLLLPCLSLTSFIFGDSLVDSGNNDYLITLSKADSPPYGIDFSASRGQPTGRFTNGRTVSDIIGQSLGVRNFPPPFLAPNSQDNATHSGINYASGSAGILMETGTLFIGRIPLQKQVDYFELTKANIVAKIGEKATKKLLKNSLFSVAIGSNDILNYIQPSIPFIGQKNVEPRLHKLGASKFVIVGIGPLGCIPFVRAMKLDWFEKCSIEVNELIQGYNRKLNMKLRLMNEELGQKAVFVYANSYDIFKDIIFNNLHYGFENAKDPCCGGYFPPFLCFKGKDTNKTSSLMCEDRSKYVFWDAYHPTEAANLIIANKLLDGDQTVTSPLNIRQLFQ
ncbi:hypothetical protein RDABS01_027958 [Bienertia sinuspersici]